MPKSKTRSMDEAALMAFAQENLLRRDWQGRALARVATMVHDLGVSWPTNPKVGPRHALVSSALAAIEACRAPRATPKDIFRAGVAAGRVYALWENGNVRRKGRPDTHQFYVTACSLVAQGMGVRAAHTKTRILFQKTFPSAPVPEYGAFKQHLAELKGKG